MSCRATALASLAPRSAADGRCWSLARHVTDSSEARKQVRPVFSPLRTLHKAMPRSFVGWALFLSAVGGLIHSAATKEDQGLAGILFFDQSGLQTPVIAPVAVDVTGLDVAVNIPPATNLCFWGIVCSSNYVSLGIAWPGSTAFANDCIDLYGSSLPSSNGWTRMSQIDVSGAMSNAVVNVPFALFPSNAMETAAFFRMASQDDADGDGLPDAYEAWSSGTDPADSDSDGDGLSDGEEVSLGGDPVSSDTDGDGLPDGVESGFVVKSPLFEWYDTTGWTTRRSSGYWTSSPFGLWGWWCTSFSSSVLSEHCVCGRTIASMTGFETGYVAFSVAGAGGAWVYPEGPVSLDREAMNSGNFLVAPYWSNTYLNYGDTDSYIRYGSATNGAFVVEFHNVKKSIGSALGMTYQVIVPPGTGNVFRVSYYSSDWWLDGVGAVVGVQFTDVHTASGYYNLIWDFSKNGPILPQTTVEYHVGYGTNPLLTDSDGDGIDDDVEIQMGINPVKADTDGDGLSDGEEISLGTDAKSNDTDGDGLKDGWEVMNDIDPLSDIGADGANGDPDGDGLGNLREQTAGTDPNVGDTDGDGLSDGAEVSIYHSNPKSSDTDGDGLSDSEEVSLGTDPRLTDTDGDELSDEAEVNMHGCDPLSPDSDGDGLSDGEEILLGTDPILPDTDGDGMDDGWENVHGFDPTVDNTTDSDPDNDSDADPDADGLTNGQECENETDPFDSDTDDDGLFDGWEASGGIDPLSGVGDDGPNGDPDGDGLVNSQEQDVGTNPTAADTDDDGVSDIQELMNGSNPCDGSDGGNPSPSYPYRGLTFNVYGDYAAWQMSILGVGPVDYQTYTVSMSSPGVGNDKLKILKKGNSYRLSMQWLNSDGHTDPYWYCWQARINGLPMTPSYQSYTSMRLPGNEVVYGLGWLAENASGLLSSHVHTHDGAGGNIAGSLQSLLHVYKCEVTVCDPDDNDWGELDASRVILDNEDLRIRVRIEPAIATYDLCRLVFGSNICIKTSGTCPAGVDVPITAASFSVHSDHSEIRMTKTRQQLKSLGLLPQNDEDGVDEMAVYDVGSIGGIDGSDLSDSSEFAKIGYQWRGKATNEMSLNLYSSPPNSILSKSFSQAAGCEIIEVVYGCGVSARRQIMNQADYFYYSGHGDHRFGKMDAYEPSEIGNYWKKDLDCVIFAGCAILDINDYNNNYILDPSNHTASPGKLWGSKGPSVFLGYNYYSPLDETGAPARIIADWLSRRSVDGNILSWMKANNNRNGRNACAILHLDDTHIQYNYFKREKGYLFNSYILTNTIESITK